MRKKGKRKEKFFTALVKGISLQSQLELRSLKIDFDKDN